MKEIDVWPTYNFECEEENCGYMNSDICDDFDWNSEIGCYTINVVCEKCGKEYIAKKG